ncbi:type II toxin-antitoxin system RelE/ParE family toxin [soil metagenome]
MATVVYSPQSIKDLAEIWDYVAHGSPEQADKLIERFRLKLQYLAQYNLLGRPRPELADHCRSAPVGRYGIYYRPIEDGIELLRLIHASRDIKRIRFHK